ncbi:MAG TPA: 23S rRNA (adenine(2503)-C(2))-methyltransferase RlmN [Chloroflexi bacterium]|nr:23S rRNA (adenine(2503)-C(2))-methyltransferase RlmN [Chloroflexota bacterium]
MAKKFIYDLSIEELATFLQESKQPKFRITQLLDGLYKKHYASFEQFANLPNTLRSELEENFVIDPIVSHSSISSRDKRTVKFLFEVSNHNFIETVLMKYADRNTVCVSTQVGCPLGCVFCATGQMGFTRNLLPNEIVGQITFIMRHLEDSGEKLTNVVYMGMGEPFLNYDAVMRSIDTLTSPDMLNFGSRRITISTVGIISKIKEFTALDSQVNLAISLHAPDNELRSQLVPNNRLHPLKDLLVACREYVDKTRRRITFEYALIQDVNDSETQARQLAGLLKGMLCHVNLIALNPSKDYDFPGSERARVDAFEATLQKAGIPCSVRLRRGIEINAGCGQLAQAQQSK